MSKPEKYMNLSEVLDKSISELEKVFPKESKLYKTARDGNVCAQTVLLNLIRNSISERVALQS